MRMDSRKGSLEFWAKRGWNYETRQGHVTERGGEKEQKIAQCRRGCSENQQYRQESTCFPLVPFNVHLGFTSLNGYVSLLVLKTSDLDLQALHTSLQWSTSLFHVISKFYFSSTMRSHDSYYRGFERANYWVKFLVCSRPWSWLWK